MSNHAPTKHPTTTVPPGTGAAPSAEGTRSRHGSPGQRASAVAGAAAAALVVWVVAGPVLGVDLTAQESPGSSTTVSVTAGSVIVSSVVIGLLGWAMLALLERVTRRGVIVWRAVAGAFALLSLGGPLTLAQTAGGAIVLTLLHVVVAAVLLIALPGRTVRVTAR